MLSTRIQNIIVATILSFFVIYLITFIFVLRFKSKNKVKLGKINLKEIGV
jgi:hypothetical protein